MYITGQRRHIYKKRLTPSEQRTVRTADSSERRRNRCRTVPPAAQGEEADWKGLVPK